MDRLDQDTVAIVIDSCFGEKITQIAPHVGAIWVIDTKINSAAVLAARRAGAKNITLVAQIPGETKETQLFRVINEVDEHEGPCSKNQPYKYICVFVDSDSKDISQLIINAGFQSVTKDNYRIFGTKADSLKSL
ncbi:hypothetical protein [Methylocystis parvus]|uniref:Uncharacterized protein n=1 Tax=Methylocystis parvus TaxID=134 RepID=A0A6B8M696_9HYPH|nr:hypothetical protein [Methylocystis parvus]QGM97936.1 hypothetical protein F7D14_10940 [Methylocystis parvus]WBK01751.1 hypothetical protein MMG94_08635 [Methylocystis parvus OBBP]